jgi:hypothetical protein
MTYVGMKVAVHRNRYRTWERSNKVSSCKYSKWRANLDNQDEALERRIRGIVAVVAGDIDAIAVTVEDQIAYIEGVVPTEHERQAILSAVRQVKGLARVIACLAVEHAMPRINNKTSRLLPAPVLMHYHRLS